MGKRNDQVLRRRITRWDGDEELWGRRGVIHKPAEVIGSQSSNRVQQQELLSPLQPASRAEPEIQRTSGGREKAEDRKQRGGGGEKTDIFKHTKEIWKKKHSCCWFSSLPLGLSILIFRFFASLLPHHLISSPIHPPLPRCPFVHLRRRTCDHNAMVESVIRRRRQRRREYYKISSSSTKCTYASHWTARCGGQPREVSRAAAPTA